MCPRCARRKPWWDTFPHGGTEFQRLESIALLSPCPLGWNIGVANFSSFILIQMLTPEAINWLRLHSTR